MKFNGRHCVFPSGSVCWPFVDLMTTESNHLALGHYPAECCLVFGSVILQRDRMIKKGSDLHHLLEKCLNLWQEDKFDLLIQEATQSDYFFVSIILDLRPSEDHLSRVFSKLLLEGNVRAAIHLVTELAGGGVSDPDATILSGQNSFIFVRDALLCKHPKPCVPPVFVLPVVMPSLFFDVEVCAAHVQAVVCRIHGGAGPGGCDAAYWRDVLHCYDAHSGHLRDSNVAVAHRLCNSITPWDDVRALVAGCLIALDKCPGVQSIGIGETLHRVIGKVVCMATRPDIEVVCESDQLCTGLKAGIEGAVHAMSDLYDARLTLLMVGVFPGGCI